MTETTNDPQSEIEAAPVVFALPPAQFLTHDTSGDVTGHGFTPDGTIPVNGIECTAQQAQAWQGSTIFAGAIVPPPPPTSAQLGTTARAQRDALLAKTDWTQGRDVPDALAGKWAAYRQALRDLPKLKGFPESFTWPVSP